MAVYKEINRADGSGVTTFYRISDILDTVETDDKESQSVVIDYNQAQNKPSINGVALVGNKTSEDLGLQPAGDYITNNEADEKFIDEDELEAKNYVNQTELQDAIAHIEHFHREIVEALPVTGMDNVLYMVRKGGTGEDIYNEYIWVGLSNSENGYEFLGTTATDLTDYYKKSQVDAALATKVDKEGGKGLSEENYTLAEKTKLAGLKNYDDTEIQAEVSGLNTDMNNLKKSNVTISNTLAELKPDVDSNTAAVSTIYDLLDNKMTAIRLVEQGDGWVWMNLEGSRLTYAQASAALGHENCMLFIEQLENDGKVIPAEYKSDGDHINVIFKDLDSLVHIMTCGEDDVVVTKDVTTTNGQVDFTVEDEAIGYTTKMTALYGKSTQETRSGKNLLENKTKKSGISKGITFTLNGDGSYTLNGTNDGTGNSTVFLSGSSNPTTLKAGTYYTIPTPNGVQIVGAKIGGGYFQLAPSSTNQFTLNEDTQAQIYIQVPNGITTTYNNIKVYPMISTAPITQTDYEPYGVMPSPDYPSPIESITEISATVTGKNLISTTIFNANNYISQLLHLKVGNYTIKYTGDVSSGIYVRKNDGTTPINGTVVIEKYNLNTMTFSISEEGLYYIQFYKSGTGFANFENAQLEEGTVATTYEPYQSNTLTINLQGNELCSLPNGTKDELVVENGRAKIIKRIGKVVLDGSETWYMDKELTNTVRFYTSEILTNKAKNAQPILSNYFITATSVNNINNDDTESAYVLNTTQPAIRINKSIANTLTTFKNWLSTHNTQLDYELAAPIEIEITDPTLLAQLNALEQITQYKHTYITITGDDLTPEADFTYINNVVINNTDSVLGKDTYWNDEVPTQQDLPSKAQEGEIRIVQDTEDVYIYNGTKWVPFDKNSEVDLSNYLTKDNTTPWVPTGPFNPSTKKYVDDSVGGIHIPTKTSQLQNDSDFVIKTTNELTNYYTKNNTYTKNEVDALVAGGSGTSDYSDLTNKPKINNVELSGNKLLSDLGIINLNNVLDGNAIGSARTIGAKDSEGQLLGEYAWAEGKDTIASGNRSHAEGDNATASNFASHAEGNRTTASGESSHAEGSNTTASGIQSHAEGYNTTASGQISHAEGRGTVAQGKNQHVQGIYNIEDTTSAHIVGNGGDNYSRSNAYTLDWSGNAWFAGDVYTGSTSGKNKDEGSKILATKEYVDDSVNGIVESGSNTNGSWTKWADGTMIINKTVLGTANITNAWGSLYVSADINLGDFPVAFIETPTIVVSPQTQTGTQYMLIGQGGSGYGTETNAGYVALVRPNSRTGVDYRLEVMAKGKWK